MKTTTILSTIAIMATSVFAAPAGTTTASAAASTASAGPFNLMSIRSASDIQYATINARNSKFFIGKNTDAYCPADNDEIPCGSFGNSTQVRLYGDQLSMDVSVPGGQTVYIGPKGALRFTEPHTYSMPKGSTTGGFSITEEDGGVYASIGHEGGFLACPVDAAKGGYPYQIFVGVKGFSRENCTGFDFAAVNSTQPGAFEYL